MAKKVYTTEKAKTLNEQMKAIRKIIRDYEEKINDIYYQYNKMEGMYGKAVFSPWDCGQGMKGYHYEYDTPEIEEKEKKERKQFLIDNGYYTMKDEINHYYDVVLPTLNNEYYLEQYGMTYKEKMRQDRIERVKKRIKELEKELEETKECLEKLKNE